MLSISGVCCLVSIEYKKLFVVAIPCDPLICSTDVQILREGRDRVIGSVSPRRDKKECMFVDSCGFAGFFIAGDDDVKRNAFI